MDASVLVFGLAVHWDNPKPNEGVAEYHNFNPGLGAKVSWEDRDSSLIRYNVVAGGYRNSIDRQSMFAGPGMEYGSAFGVQANLVYLDGYENNVLPVVPMFGAYARAKSVSVHAVYMGSGVGIYAEFKL